MLKKLKHALFGLSLKMIKDEKIYGFFKINIGATSLSWDALDIPKFITSPLLSSNISWENKNWITFPSRSH